MRLLSALLSRLELPAEVAARCSLAVASVDGYQGREADCVIFSAVRCNSQGRVGFLADERRLNVAITRPRRGLIVVGHEATLAHDPTWAQWMGWVAAQRARRAELAPAVQAPMAAEEERQADEAQWNEGQQLGEEAVQEEEQQEAEGAQGPGDEEIQGEQGSVQAVAAPADGTKN